MKKLNLVYFSPTGNTRKTLHALAKGAAVPFTEFDLTHSAERQKTLSFSAEDFVILGAPVYAGRLPSKPENLFEQIEGNDTPAVLVVTYGAREYDDALLELQNLAIEKGFNPVAAAIFLGEHSYTNKVAAGRPDAEDIKTIETFGRKIRDTYLSGENLDGTLIVKGNYPYRSGMVYTPLAPKVSDACTACGECVPLCPTDAIPADNPKETDPYACIRCCACIKACKEKARAFDHPDFTERVKFLEKNFANRRKAAEFFFAQ